MEQNEEALQGVEENGAKKPSKRPKEVRFYSSWCKRCGICAAFCPTGAIELGEDECPEWKNPDACVGCRMCEYRCPDFAVEVIPFEEDEDASAE